MSWLNNLKRLPLFRHRYPIINNRWSSIISSFSPSKPNSTLRLLTHILHQIIRRVRSINNRCSISFFGWLTCALNIRCDDASEDRVTCNMVPRRTRDQRLRDLALVIINYFLWCAVTFNCVFVEDGAIMVTNLHFVCCDGCTVKCWSWPGDNNVLTWVSGCWWVWFRRRNRMQYF